VRAWETWVTDVAFILSTASAITFMGESLLLFAKRNKIPTPAPSGDFELLLETTGRRFLDVVKVLQESCNMTYKEARPVVESAPVVVCTEVSHDYAKTVAGKLEKVGATVIVRHRT
jgi:ribosomal protein L7/L12